MAINKRIYFVMVMVVILGTAIFSRLFWLQIYKNEHYSSIAEAQRSISGELLPERGEIFATDKEGNLFPLAINEDRFRVYLEPNKINEVEFEFIAETLNQELGVEKEIISKALNKRDDPYEPITKNITKEKAEILKSKKIVGLGFIPEKIRIYPLGGLTAHIIGFLGIGENDAKIGQYGLENYYDDIIRGKPGFLKNSYGNNNETTEDDFFTAPVDGKSLILTIDKNIQFFVADVLFRYIEKLSATAGSVIVMEPRTGKVLSLAVFPDFDPNNYSQVKNIELFINPVIQSRFEPGSTFKSITMAAALDSGSVEPETVYNDKGSETIGSYTIQNSDKKSHGEQTMTNVLELSLNTGAIFAYRQTGMDSFLNYAEDFNFDKLSGIDLFGEIKGDISNLRSYRDINYATASFGQGIAVTPISMASAVSALANNGNLMKPYIVEKIIGSKTEEIIKPVLVKEVISKETSRKLTDILVSVVKNGYGKKGAVAGYEIAGKTGTAQISNKEEKGYIEETIHSFVGYAPAYNPEFLIFIKLDKPQEIKHAADSIAPMFSEIASFILNYLEIKPNY